MIVVHGETLWSPAPQPIDDDDENNLRHFLGHPLNFYKDNHFSLSTHFTSSGFPKCEVVFLVKMKWVSSEEPKIVLT